MARSDLEQAIVNHVKVARAAIRLRHSIEADTEINATIDKIRARLASQAQQGLIPSMTVTEILSMTGDE